MSTSPVSRASTTSCSSESARSRPRRSRSGGGVLRGSPRMETLEAAPARPGEAGALAMSKTKVLYVMHNHPTLFPGGAEVYALELFEALRGSDEIEPLLMARISRASRPAGNRPGTPFLPVDG